ncbi:hypothetical protein [Nocardia suismassiliense]|uniref:hypothetical protein n=1 Tax=Nocardia suismassiliense TaxID=2077092 RepID=UPI000D1DC5F2|nr:hypothetical protein [Nocardia suismassiliense]
MRVSDDYNRRWQFIGTIPAGPGRWHGTAVDWFMDPAVLTATIPGTAAATALSIGSADLEVPPATAPTGLVAIPARPGRGFAGGEVRRTPEGWIAVHIGVERLSPWVLVGDRPSSGERRHAFRLGCASEKVMADAETLGALPHTPAAAAHLITSFDPALARANYITVIDTPDADVIARWLDEHHKPDRLQRREGGRDRLAAEIVDEVRTSGYTMISCHEARSGEIEYLTSDTTRLPSWAAQRLHPAVFNPPHEVVSIGAPAAATPQDTLEALTAVVPHPGPTMPTDAADSEVAVGETIATAPTVDTGAGL